MFTKFLVALIASLPILLSLTTAADAQMLDSRIRYTTGAVVRTGWEKELVKGNKNLKQYYWGAMVDYTQAYKKVPLPTRPELEAFKNKQGAETQTSYHYTKPVHVALPRRDFSPVQDIHRNQDVYAHLSNPTVSAKLAHQEKAAEQAVSAKLTKAPVTKPEVATYEDMPQGPASAYASTRGNLADREVRGRLLH